MLFICTQARSLYILQVPCSALYRGTLLNKRPPQILVHGVLTDTFLLNPHFIKLLLGFKFEFLNNSRGY